MDEISNLAARYFDRFEALSLYPRPNSKEFWLSLLSALIFLLAMVWYLRQDPRAQSGFGATAIILLADGALLWSIHHIKSFHRKAALALANEGRGSNLQSVATAKAATLCRFLNCRTYEFLRVAAEIQQLRALDRTGKRSSTSWPQLAGIDEEARSRLMSMLLCILAVVVTILATNPAARDEFFDAVANEDVWRFIGLMQFFALLLLSVTWGMLWLTRVGANIAMRWSVKLSNSPWANARKVDYLVQDLVHLHRMPPRRLRTATHLDAKTIDSAVEFVRDRSVGT